MEAIVVLSTDSSYAILPLIPFVIKAVAVGVKKHGAHKVSSKLTAKAKHKKPVRKKKSRNREEEE